MKTPLDFLRPWVIFAGSVLVVGVLYWARAVIVPCALAILLTFLLTPIVSPLQRRIGRVAAVLTVVIATFAALGLGGWGLSRQVTTLADDLPKYQDNIRRKIRDLRGVSEKGPLEKLQRTVEGVVAEIDRGSARGEARPVVLPAGPESGLRSLLGALGSVVGWLATAVVVIVLVIFMLLEREHLRNRLIVLFGYGRLAMATRALDEAARRVSRYLLFQFLICATVATGVGVGLFLIGVPFALLWAFLAAIMQFVPYVGPWIAAAGPLLLSLAVFDGWREPLLVAGLFTVLEVTARIGVEPLFYARAAGISQVALLVAVIFWAWLWGPIGLLIATPLTVCLAVIGKYVPGLKPVAMLLSDEPALSPDVSYYQRLLADDRAEAADILERYVKDQASRPGAAETIYDSLMLPALTYARRDRLEGALTEDEERAVADGTRDLLVEAEALTRPALAPDGTVASRETVLPVGHIPVLGVPSDGDADAVALHMLGHLLKGTSFRLEILSDRAHASDLVEAVKTRGCNIVCVVDLPPRHPSRSRYLVRRLRAARPDVTILVARWAPATMADDAAEVLRAAGADHVSTTVLETRDQIEIVGTAQREEPSAPALARGIRGRLSAALDRHDSGG